MTDYSDLKVFLAALVEIEGRPRNSSLTKVYVKYRVGEDDDVVKQWAPIRKEDIGESGLMDPGFGSGPYYYSDLECVMVRRADWVEEEGETGRQNYIDLLEMVSGTRTLAISDFAVVWSS